MTVVAASETFLRLTGRFEGGRKHALPFQLATRVQLIGNGKYPLETGST